MYAQRFLFLDGRARVGGTGAREMLSPPLELYVLDVGVSMHSLCVVARTAARRTRVYYTF